MIVNVPYREGDDKTYLAAVCSLVASLANSQKPTDIYITRVNKWFDRKWLRYSGKGRVGYYGGIAMWRENLTFPPFNPKQIGTQLYWRKRSDGSYGGGPMPRWIHKRQLRHSAGNLNNRVADFTDSGLFVWFTSHTQNNGHGSILVYSVAGKDVSSWYASLKQESGWRIDKVDGIGRASVERHFPIT
jgi:hypothetical protein